MCGDEDSFDPIRYSSVLVGQFHALGEVAHQVSRVKPFVLGYVLEVGVDLDKLLSLQNVASIAEGEKRLDSAGAADDYAQAAGGRDGRACRIPDPHPAGYVVRTTFECGKNAPLPGQINGGLQRLFTDKTHDVFRRGYRFIRVVRYAKLNQHVGKAHDAKPDLPRQFRHALYFRQGEFVAVDDVVEDVDGQPDNARQSVVVYLGLAVLLAQHA